MKYTNKMCYQGTDLDKKVSIYNASINFSAILYYFKICYFTNVAYYIFSLSL